MTTSTVTPIKAFSDNYIWSIGTTTKSNIALVDPGDAQVCIDYINKNQLILSAILITHHHADHTGGINVLVDFCKEKSWPLTIYGPANEHIPQRDIALVEDDVIELKEIDIKLTIIDLPGHTAGHIAYVNEHSLFCGDTLFSGGCGRLFEGTAQQMYQSLNKLSGLSENVQVFCAHEYTAANLAFALTVDPENIDLINYFNQVSHLRAQNKATIPSSIGLEKSINPFLRCQLAPLQQSAEDYTNSKVALGVDTFTVIRDWKNNF
ncbi:MAG: hydroxyacylglutathione hydrolase [Alteromonadaceae bacterium]|jgi:hydroxyacylglutathione hydrolase|tara:strand:+ start:139 stop:930 length:792 start_codon:yes stop_codon:yes gene_type:complete